jgi:uncharacterized protein (DUF2252 family)
VILVHGKGSPNGNYLLDLKEATPCSLLPYLRLKLPKLAQPRWPSEAHRVVAVQRRMQAVSAAFLHPVLFGTGAYVLRGLQPSEDRVTLDRSSQSMDQLQQVLASMGRLLAWAQLRSAGREGSATADELIAFGQRSKWREKMLGASHDCAEQVRADAATFSLAYDDGLFNA